MKTRVFRVIVIAAIAAVFVIFTWQAVHAGTTNHYSRPYMVVENTRQSGQWVAHCHSITTDGKKLLYVFGGCLPPVKSK